MILYFTYWFPARISRPGDLDTLYRATGRQRARLDRFGAILGMDGILGIKGWQWIFIIEAMPAVLLAFSSSG